MEDTQQPADTSTIISVDGLAVTFDSQNVLPLKIGDWRALQAQGFRMSDLRGGGADDIDIDKLSIFMTYVLGRCAPSVPGTDVAAVVNQLTLNQFMQVIGRIGDVTNPRELVDRPT